MNEITQTQAIQKALVEIVGVEAAEKVANLKGKELEEVYSLVFQQAAHYDVLPEEITVKGIVQEMYSMINSDYIRVSEPEETEDFLIQRLGILAELLGIELED